ncbi:hypothetical protein H6G17_31815 [Chroococcidiopsis sp. FACHB-1243]|uniref:hypothetical protein n=1 Tax=Chroococcidiopsis sp. [FACHB-1243] TaxID=2692781 RepID=UPI00178087AF|nr:hypothetical protein [Chroococcidiopsis sp. [FACHB-1243]]MBD2309988.1 hypothetical protein [Chroococcidiopsis sp. [FACHB-1243]]
MVWLLNLLFSSLFLPPAQKVEVEVEVEVAEESESVKQQIAVADAKALQTMLEEAIDATACGESGCYNLGHGGFFSHGRSG